MAKLNQQLFKIYFITLKVDSANYFNIYVTQCEEMACLNSGGHGLIRTIGLHAKNHSIISNASAKRE